MKNIRGLLRKYTIVDADGNEMTSKSIEAIMTSKSIEAIKVCGMTCSDNEELAYEKKNIKRYYCGSQVKGPHLTIGDPPFYS